MLRMLALSGLTAAIALAAAAAPPAASPGPIEDQVFDGANGFRADNRLGGLQSDPILVSEARAFADYLARTGKFSHTADGRDPGQRARAAGYEYCEVAENIAYVEEASGLGADRLAHIFMSGWEASPGHRRNLLDSSVTQTGVGVARVWERGEVQKYVAVQVFGRPVSMRYSFEIENRSGDQVSYEFDGASRSLPARSTTTQTTCAMGDMVFHLPGRGPSRYAAEPGARYVLENAPGGVRVEIDRPSASGGATGHD